MQALSGGGGQSGPEVNERAKSLIKALAAGHASWVRDTMANAALAESMEPLWHAAHAELGDEIGPLPAEVADAVASVRAEVEAVRAGNSSRCRLLEP